MSRDTAWDSLNWRPAALRTHWLLAYYQTAVVTVGPVVFYPGCSWRLCIPSRMNRTLMSLEFAYPRLSESAWRPERWCVWGSTTQCIRDVARPHGYRRAAPAVVAFEAQLRENSGTIIVSAAPAENSTQVCSTAPEWFPLPGGDALCRRGDDISIVWRPRPAARWTVESGEPMPELAAPASGVLTDRLREAMLRDLETQTDQAVAVASEERPGTLLGMPVRHTTDTAAFYDPALGVPYSAAYVTRPVAQDTVNTALSGSGEAITVGEFMAQLAATARPQHLLRDAILLDSAGDSREARAAREEPPHQESTRRPADSINAFTRERLREFRPLPPLDAPGERAARPPGVDGPTDAGVARVPDWLGADTGRVVTDYAASLLREAQQSAPVMPAGFDYNSEVMAPRGQGVAGISAEETGTLAQQAHLPNYARRADAVVASHVLTLAVRISNWWHAYQGRDGWLRADAQAALQLELRRVLMPLVHEYERELAESREVLAPAPVVQSRSGRRLVALATYPSNQPEKEPFDGGD